MPFFQFEGPTDPVTGLSLPISAEEHRRRAAEHERRLERAGRWHAAWLEFAHTERAWRWPLGRVGKRIVRARDRMEHHAQLALVNRMEARRQERAGAAAVR